MKEGNFLLKVSGDKEKRRHVARQQTDVLAGNDWK
jgi:hypothetical protein